jgi:hypothetical protein
MGNSAITSIYSAIASLTPTVSSDHMPKVQGYAAVNESLNADELPVRKLQAFSNESEGEMAFVALGHTINVSWTVVDRFFYRIATMGTGWGEFSDELTKYCKSYIDILRTNRAPTSQSHVVSARFVPGVYTFPEGSNQRVAGVDVILTIEEVVS